MGFLHRHRGLTPYLLLAPGLAWLALFFVVPLYYLAYTSLQDGLAGSGYTFTWAWDELHATRSRIPRRSSSARSSTPASPRSRAPDQLPAGVLDRVPRRALEEPAPALHHRALLRHVPDPDAGVAEHPRRRRLRRRTPCSARARWATTGGCSPRRPRWSPASPTTSCPSWRLPLYVSLEQIDPRLIEAAQDLYASTQGVPARDAAALAAGRLRRHAAHVHPGGRRLHQRRAARDAASSDDRQRHPVQVPGDHRLPGRRPRSRSILMAAILVAVVVYTRVLGTREAGRMTTAAETLPLSPRPRPARARGRSSATTRSPSSRSSRSPICCFRSRS